MDRSLRLFKFKKRMMHAPTLLAGLLIGIGLVIGCGDRAGRTASAAGEIIVNATQVLFESATGLFTSKNVQDALDEVASNADAMSDRVTLNEDEIAKLQDDFEGYQNPSCPAGMIQNYQVCMDEEVSTSSITFAEANVACKDAGKRLCFGHELVLAFSLDALAVTDVYEWVAEIRNDADKKPVATTIRRTATTTNAYWGGMKDVRNYRCCLDL